MNFRERAAWFINNWWIYSAYWDKKAEEEDVSWEKIALRDCKTRIYDLKNELRDLEGIKNELESRFKEYNS